jgi:cbb3-type cytochrome oxidase maturation protein
VDVLYLLIPLSVVLVFLIGVVFWFALKGGQFDDLDSPGFKLIMDDDSVRPAPPAETAQFDPSQDAAKPTR